MALILNHSSSCFSKKPHLLPHSHHFLSSPTNPTLLSIRSQDSSSQSPKPPTIADPPADSTSSIRTPQSSKSDSPGLGFGASSSISAKSSANSASTRQKERGKRERASVIRRAPVQKPGFISSPEEEAQAKEQGKNESAFLLTWFGLGAVILVQGLLLAASGFLPQEWDNFFVKYLYPTFTPTVLLFLAGTVAYGVLKYLENEKLNRKQ